MLEKIISIDNVGVLKKAAQRPVELQKVSLIYADNARGKSTLSSVLLACSTFDAKDVSDDRAEVVRRLPSRSSGSRDAELRLAARYLGDLPISRVLPNTDPEVATFCSEVERALAGSAKANYLSVQSAVDRHRDPDDALSLADFDFIHFPWWSCADGGLP
ncbi:hypothetical protein [Pseudomonas sp. AM8]|uniref:hypothetical protein n=1 Tax=Pseudomonas sp. AM8 TaxID=2983368 RepID=UPI002E813FDA|nr:hypothetical protein [Pseudomonas sp. AM8]